MDAEIKARLNGINQEFYQTFAESFSQTRGRVQPGVLQILSLMPRYGNFLDIGCGNGNLAQVWSQGGYLGNFVGLDFSPGLVAAARERIQAASNDRSISFYEADLSRDDWTSVVPELKWDAIFSFAVLHHIPAAASRLRLCRQISAIACPDAKIWISVWQPLNSPRLQKRIIEWDTLDIEADQVENGDVLMDWRAHQNAQHKPAYRYVHIFDHEELAMLAEQAGFSVQESFYSDGKEGNLGLYQCWLAKN